MGASCNIRKSDINPHTKICPNFIFLTKSVLLFAFFLPFTSIEASPSAEGKNWITGWMILLFGQLPIVSCNDLKISIKSLVEDSSDKFAVQSNNYD